MLVDGTFCDKYLCMMYWSMSRSRRNTNPVHGRQMVIIGAGNVATHFAHAFSAAGYAIVQVYSKTIDSARALAGQFGVGCTNSLSLLRTDADIYIFAVSDDALFDIALDLKLKDKICFQEETECNPVHCPYLSSFCFWQSHKATVRYLPLLQYHSALPKPLDRMSSAI